MSRDAWDEYSNTILVGYVLLYLCGTLYLDSSVSFKRSFAFSVDGLFSLSTHALTCLSLVVLICFLGQATPFCFSASWPSFDFQHPDCIACWKIARKQRLFLSPLQPLRRTTKIGKFRISGRPRTSACFRAKERLMRVTFGKKSNKHLKHEEIAAWLLESEENLKGLMFWWAPNLLADLRNHCFEQQKENQLLVTKKNNERNQKSTERVRW